MNIQCAPKGFFSSAFIMSGEGFSATLEFNWYNESGNLTLNKRNYTLQKQGAFSSEWAILCNNKTIGLASKDSFLKRTFTIAIGQRKYTLKAESALGRTMLLTGENTNVRIKPNSPFTQKTTLTGKSEEQDILAITFWLTIMLRRRAKRRNNS